MRARKKGEEVTMGRPTSGGAPAAGGGVSDLNPECPLKTAIDYC
jgi:hypothetical protein